MDNESVGTWIELERRAKSEEREGEYRVGHLVGNEFHVSRVQRNPVVLHGGHDLADDRRASGLHACTQSALSIQHSWIHGFRHSLLSMQDSRIKESKNQIDSRIEEAGRMESKETENREDLVDVVRVGRIAPHAASAEHVEEVVALDVQRVGTGLLLVLLDYHAVDVLEPLYYSQFTLLFLSHKEFRFIIEQGNIYVSN